MAARQSLIKICFLLCIFHVLAGLASAQAFTHKLTMKYFTDVSMICDHPILNITGKSDVRSVSWILPDGRTVDSTRNPNPKLFRLAGPNHHLDAYNLTVFNINDPVFGYYTCVVVYDSEAKPISVIKWGMNVDGADFSELIKTYEDNAIIGGIAAAAVLAVIATACLIWHFRYSRRHQNMMSNFEEKSAVDDVIEVKRSGHINKSCSFENEMTDLELMKEVDGSG